MSWSNGWYFSKSEDQEMHAFLEAQGLDAKQITSISTFHRMQVTSALNLWVGFASLGTFIAGIMVARFWLAGSCWLF